LPLIASNCNCNPSALFKTINTVDAPKFNGFEASTEICERFLHFFTDKIVSTRACISQPSYDPSIPLPVFAQFEPLSLSILKDTVSHKKPSGSPADAIPPCLFKKRYLVQLDQASLRLSIVTSPLVQYLGILNIQQYDLYLKKQASTPLSYISKILEKVVYNQLLPFLEENDITELFQSGFKPLHSTFESP